MPLDQSGPTTQPTAADTSRAAATPDRTEAWLTLLGRLTERVPGWMVMKSVESALTGTGDVDSVAALEAWPHVIAEVRTWAAERGLGPVIVCPHVPYVLHLITLDPDRPFFYELDVNRRKIFLGSTLFYPRDLFPLSVMDARGFRITRAGTEGLLKLVQNGERRGGRPDWEGVRKKRIVELLTRDPEGVREGSRLFGRGADAVVRVAQAVIEGRWDRQAMLQVEAHCILRGLGDVTALAARVRFRVVRRQCPVLKAVFEGGRQVPDDRHAWLEAVRQSHEVHTK
jgi:hypothetical protein